MMVVVSVKDVKEAVTPLGIFHDGGAVGVGKGVQD